MRGHYFPNVSFSWKMGEIHIAGSHFRDSSRNKPTGNMSQQADDVMFSVSTYVGAKDSGQITYKKQADEVIFSLSGLDVGVVSVECANTRGLG